MNIYYTTTIKMRSRRKKEEGGSVFSW